MKQIFLITLSCLISSTVCSEPQPARLTMPTFSSPSPRFPDAEITFKYIQSGTTMVRHLHPADGPLMMHPDGSAEFIKNYRGDTLSDFFNLGPKTILWCGISIGITLFIIWFANPFSKPVDVRLTNVKNKNEKPSKKQLTSRSPENDPNYQANNANANSQQ